jgi:hypothetical protein
VYIGYGMGNPGTIAIGGEDQYPVPPLFSEGAGKQPESGAVNSVIVGQKDIHAQAASWRRI